MHWPWPVNGHPHQDAGCQRSHFKPRKSHTHPGAGWFWPKLGTRDGILWASGFFLLSPPRPFWGYDRCRVSSPLQCVRPESSPGQTMGHKKRRKARKKHKSQTRHGVENVKRKNNPVGVRRHDEETQSQNGQVPPGFLASWGGPGGLGRWDGRDERYVPTSPDHGPEDALCCPPRGPAMVARVDRKVDRT